jgi:hypothetical protein
MMIQKKLLPAEFQWASSTKTNIMKGYNITILSTGKDMVERDKKRYCANNLH